MTTPTSTRDRQRTLRAPQRSRPVAMRAVGGRVRSLYRRIPRAGRICFLIGFINAAIWTVVVPPFQVPDEIAHFAYAQYLAEVGKPPPQTPTSPYSPEEEATLDQLDFFSVIGRPQLRGITTRVEDEALRRELSSHLSPVSTGGSSSQSNEPPLYYGLVDIPYLISPWHEILARLALMRLLSALLAGGTVLAVYLFLRELLPQSPWSWTVGALVVAFQPTFDFISAGVQAENLLVFVAAVTFLLLLRAYRHGLTYRRALFLGAVIAAGTLSKLTYIAFLPGIGLALLLLLWRSLPQGHKRALGMFCSAIAVAALPVIAYGVLNIVVWHRGGFTANGIAAATNSHVGSGQPVTLHETLDYIWQLYLPKLPFMNHEYFPHEYPLLTVWLNGFIGHFGWLDYTFPAWVYTAARWIFLGLLVLAVGGFVRMLDRFRELWPMLACFCVIGAGLLGAIGYVGIRYQVSTGDLFAQARYLLPLLVFYATFVVLASCGAGRRLARPLAAVLVLLAMTHGLFAETLTISRYYG